MSFAPKQNWPAYHNHVEPKQIEKDRSLSATQKAQRYAEIFDSVWSLKNSNHQNRSIVPVEDVKLQLRAKRLVAYRNVLESNCDWAIRGIVELNRDAIDWRYCMELAGQLDVVVQVDLANSLTRLREEAENDWNWFDGEQSFGWRSCYGLGLNPWEGG